MNEAKVKGCFVGIDVSKETVDVFVRPGGQSWTQPREDYERLCETLEPLKPTLIVLEPTGGYEVGVLNALIKRGFRVSREHALRIHHHAKASGQMAKTDRLDASVIAHYAQCYSQEIEPMAEPLDEAQGLLEQLSTRRVQLVETRAAEKNRLGVPNLRKEVQLSCRRMIRLLSREIEGIERQIQQIIEGEEEKREKKRILETAKGVGAVVSTVLVAYLPELGRVNRKQIAALVGVAPFQHQSGKFKGQQRIKGGRAEVRSALYMAALSAKKHSPPIRALYQRLLKKGKKKKVALVACMHKLLRMLNAMLSKGENYQPSVG
jgi:Transposase and inactivated derivatives